VTPRHGRSGTSIAEETAEGEMKSLSEHVRSGDETGAIGYILLWIMGVPATLLFLIFLLRGCN
jgi:hypothetical protein